MGKRIPERKCLGCGSLRGKDQLIRFSVREDGTVIPDPGKEQDGRGAYVCKDPECIRLMFKRRSLERTLRCRLTDENREMLEKELEKIYG